MSQSELEEARSSIEEWAQDAHENAVGIAEMLNIGEEDYGRDPLLLIGPLQDYVSRLPLQEFEEDDWITLHNDLASYVADVMVQVHGAAWRVVEDATASRGFRYVVAGLGHDGQPTQVDPFDVIMEEFKNPPVQVARALANAEVVLGANPLV